MKLVYQLEVVKKLLPLRTGGIPYQSALERLVSKEIKHSKEKLCFSKEKQKPNYSFKTNQVYFSISFWEADLTSSDTLSQKLFLKWTWQV